MFSPQIHIVFNSREDERITKPIVENPPNKLYYFKAFVQKTNQRDMNLEFFEKNVEFIKKRVPSLEIIPREVDYTNYIEIIQELSKIIKYERESNPNCHIFINVSSGSKMTSIASTEASRLWDCEIYYLYSSQYVPNGKGPRHKGEFYIMEPITFPINKPDKIYIKTLRLIQDLISNKYRNKEYDISKRKFIYFKRLIEELESEGLVKLDNEHNDPRSRKSALYMKTRHFFGPLIEDLNYIELSDDKRNKKVFLTQKGKDILKIFKYYI
jgi:predicted transcriptional regulator